MSELNIMIDDIKTAVLAANIQTMRQV